MTAGITPRLISTLTARHLAPSARLLRDRDSLAPSTPSDQILTPAQVRQLHQQLAAPSQFTKEQVQGYYLDSQGEALSAVGKALYAKVRHRYLEGVPPSAAPTLYMTGGLPGSGKGRVGADLAQQAPPFVSVDADLIKDDILRDLAEKSPALRPSMEQCKEWASVVHKISRVMAHDLVLESLHEGKDTLFDSTLAAPARDEYRDFVGKARAQGYRVEARMCEIEVNKALERAEARAKKPVVVQLEDGPLTLPGRFVPPQIITGAHEGLVSNRKAFLEEGLFDQVFLYDNNRDGQPPVLVATYQRVCQSDGSCVSQLIPPAD